MLIRDWSSDVCSSDLNGEQLVGWRSRQNAVLTVRPFGIMLEPERLVGNIHKLQFPLRPIGYAARRFFLIPPKDQQAGFTQDIGRMLEKAAQPVLPVPRNGIERQDGKLGDRKSVVEGRRGADCVDNGGGRGI